MLYLDAGISAGILSHCLGEVCTLGAFLVSVFYTSMLANRIEKDNGTSPAGKVKFVGWRRDRG